jgi:hypothetical protein
MIDIGGAILGFVLIGIGIFLYFVPWYIAHQRHHPNMTAIAVLNVFLGWTFVGWVVALVWSATAIPTKPAAPVNVQPEPEQIVMSL